MTVVLAGETQADEWDAGGDEKKKMELGHVCVWR